MVTMKLAVYFFMKSALHLVQNNDLYLVNV